jgi:hypothetical protein
MMRVVVGNAPAGASTGHTVAPIELEWENLSVDELLSIATTTTLMGDTQVFRFSGALASGRAEEFLDTTKELVASPHLFVFTEDKLLKKPTDTLKKAGAEVVVHAPPKKDDVFNMFAVTYAFASRDRKKLWLLLLDAERHGAVPEATAGMLHWKVRDMLGKGERGKYTSQDLRRISTELVTLYHEGHRGGGELSLLLERFVLTL